MDPLMGSGHVQPIVHVITSGKGKARHPIMSLRTLLIRRLPAKVSRSNRVGISILTHLPVLKPYRPIACVQDQIT